MNGQIRWITIPVFWGTVPENKYFQKIPTSESSSEEKKTKKDQNLPIPAKKTTISGQNKKLQSKKRNLI